MPRCSNRTLGMGCVFGCGPAVIASKPNHKKDADIFGVLFVFVFLNM